LKQTLIRSRKPLNDHSHHMVVHVFGIGAALVSVAAAISGAVLAQPVVMGVAAGAASIAAFLTLPPAADKPKNGTTTEKLAS
jgi:hypothetical protein